MKKSKNLEEIEKYRQAIDHIDAELLQLLGKRFELSKKIASHKHSEGLPIHQEAREKEILGKRLKEGREKGLSDAFVTSLFQAIFFHSKEKQKEPGAFDNSSKI